MSSGSYQLLHPLVQRFLFDKGWKTLRPIQTDAIRCVYESEDHLLITASTAGGKTEAAFLPAISKLIPEGEAASPAQTLGALYVGPLKALINDQFERVGDLCADLEIPVHRWHGDVSASQKQAFRKHPGGVLLITPESLESNFINYGAQVPRIYQKVQFIVIDELHSFLGNVRGMHLLSLLCRLVQTAGCRPRLIGLSATLGGTEAAVAFLSHLDGRKVTHIDDSEGSKEIKLTIKPYGHISKTTDDTAALQDVARELVPLFQRTNNLIFVNSRRTAEALTLYLKELAPNEERFGIHHGSISKEIRAETEQALKGKAQHPLTIVCSSTLEMGIDLGSVNAVGQIDPPWTVASLRQRLGRSGRRDGEVSKLHQFVHVENSTDLLELLQLDLIRSIAMIELMIEKWLEPSVLNKFHFSTLVFQILSVLRETGGILPLALFERLCGKGAFRQINQSDFTLLLRNLKAKDLLEQMPDLTLILTPQGEGITHDLSFYAAFSGNETYTLRHGGDVIGDLPFMSIPPPGQLVILAAQRWRVEDIDHPRKVVWVIPAKAGVVPRFCGSACSIHGRITQMMRSILLGTRSFTYVHPSAAEYLASARQAALKLNLQADLVPLQGGCLWFPWVGTEALSALFLLAIACGRTVTLEPFNLHFHTPEADILLWAKALLLRKSWQDLLEEIPANLLMVEKYDEFVPTILLRKTVLQERLDLDGARAALTVLVEK